MASNCKALKVIQNIVPLQKNTVCYYMKNILRHIHLKSCSKIFIIENPFKN